MSWRPETVIIPVPKSIVWRVVLFFMLVSAMNFMLMGVSIRESVEHHFEHQDRRLWEGKVELIGNILMGWRSPDDNMRIHGFLADAMVGHHDLSVKVVSAAQGFQFESGEVSIPDSFMDRSVDEKGGMGFSPFAWSDGTSLLRGVSGTLPTGRSGVPMRVVLISNTGHHMRFLSTFDKQLAFICIVALLVTGGTSWIATKRGLIPLSRMATVVEGISGSRLKDRIVTRAIPDELLSLAHSFNAMLDRLSESMEKLTQFSSDLAHEVRTPINNLMMQTQVSLSKPRSTHQYEELLYSNLEEYERLARIISDMLFIAKADHGLFVPRRVVVRIASEVDALFDFHDPVASEYGVTLRREGDATILADPLMIRRAMSNLIENAIKHTQSGGTVFVRTRNEEGQVSITVTNPGEPIP